ncbi:hypothetical protein FNB79_09725 [Formosa sediminum]|uniref:Uncharacterized protein n=1 Tax=Formosa sediminum TaxID=2594004 RepID=A0A516GRT7_9FLAO|nr:hypothetical protein [Formosa sediminum]QDO94237.1 hypothetical protein FNB79_09725 [Formosa sediminum]
MEEKIYQVDERNIKSIFFGRKEFIFSKEKIEVSVQFTELHKYPRLIEKTVRIRFGDIKKLIINENEVKIKAYVKMNSLSFNETFKLKEKDFITFKEQLETLQYEKNLIQESKYNRLLNHHGVFTVLSGAIFTYLLSTGANFSNTEGKNKFFGYLIQKIIETLGLTISISISLLILLYGIYTIWKKINEPNDVNSNKVEYSNLKVK